MSLQCIHDNWVERPSGLLVPSKAKLLTAVDLFAGCGGFSLGIISAGFHVLAAVEWDAIAAMTYMVNLGAYPIDIHFVEDADRDRFEKQLTSRTKKGVVANVPLSGSNRDPNTAGVPVFWFGDIRKISGEQILKSIGLESGELDLVVGGPPCQGFSIQGKRNIMDPRNSLVFDFARLVCEMQPKTLCMENVPGILSMCTEQGIPVIDEFCAILERGSYGEHEALLRMLTGDKRAKIARRGKSVSVKKSSAETTQIGLFANNTKDPVE